jgi:hypothetical protein
MDSRYAGGTCRPRLLRALDAAAAEEGEEFPSLQLMGLHSVPCQPVRRISN